MNKGVSKPQELNRKLLNPLNVEQSPLKPMRSITLSTLSNVTLPDRQ